MCVAYAVSGGGVDHDLSTQLEDYGGMGTPGEVISGISFQEAESATEVASIFCDVCSFLLERNSLLIPPRKISNFQRRF